MDIQIRRAVKEDCPRLLELITELAIYEKAPDDVTVTIEHFIESGFGKSPVWWAFVATSNLSALPNAEKEIPPSPFMEKGLGDEPSKVSPSPPVEKGLGDEPSKVSPSPPVEKGLGDEVIGFALYYTRYSTWKGQAMYLEDIIVTEEMRGKKIGKLLFERLIEEAKEKKYNRIIWQVLKWNEQAINFYRKYNAEFDGEWFNCSVYV